MKMKLFITLFCCLALLAAPKAVGQSLYGTWQVVKESWCLGNTLPDTSDTEEELAERMQELAGTVPKTIEFNKDGTGQENWRTQGRRKPSSQKKFMYRLNEGTLYFLDKKTRLITDRYIIEELTTESLIMFHKDRSCERVELVRVN